MSASGWRVSGSKRSYHCGKTKRITQFYGHRGRPGGRRAECIDCTKAANEKYRNCERTKLRRKAYNLRRHGLTIEEFHARLEKQDGRCPICQRKIVAMWHGYGNGKGAVVDHDHETGRVRGIICSDCNRGLGYLKDSEANLAAALNYLKSR
jgi:Recombination endonuclease VII